MAAHSSTLAWKIPWTAEPGRLPSMGSQRVGHDWATSLWLSLSSRRCLCDQARKISGCWIFSGLLQKQKHCTHTLLHGLCWEMRGAVGPSVRGWAHQAAYMDSPESVPFPFMTWLCVLRILVSVQPQARLISLHFVSLCFTPLHFAHNAGFKNQLKVCSQPVSSESTGAFLPIALARLVSLCHSLVILQRFKTFHYHYYVCYGHLWSEVFDVTVVIVLGMPKTMPM